MSAFVVLAALGLLGTLPDCDELTKPQSLEDDYKSIMGKWIFHKGIADHQLFTQILKTVNSSWIEFGPSPLENTVTLSQGNMLNGKCEFSTTNAAIKDNTIYSDHNGTLSEGKFLLSCPDCLTISFVSQFKNETIKTLYFFKRDSKVEKVETDMYWKQAECLGFKTEDQYTYDGVTEFCRAAQDSSSVQEP
ncbi:saxitoxin and tetrodotoxin-binding protein 2 [Danio rerio]|uniref:Saxitoxin and tetrodotoxin-binding protein 2 n=1 Tax=Danio rerio TaxID=7955 RepID=A0A8M1QLM0_DANRE|nr:saxitoxin and tetrodotoxin-binding protein 2-like [Danio rerio]|eukprot:XP_001922616.3 saxitoxin and tetrodotoxin-binding protein 2-like [Danio rerio]